MQDLERAERDVEKATEKIEAVIEEEKHRDELKVEMFYNGVKKSFEVRRDELVNTLLDKAIKEFGPIPNPHTLSLFTEGGDELDGAVDSMRIHLKFAEDLCKQGMDHESLLHLDVVRAFLHLPEIQHPASHRYLYKG